MVEILALVLHHDEQAVLVALKAGLRQGELIGLQWGDVDFQRGKLHVRRTIWRGVSGLPKGAQVEVDAILVLP